MAGRILTVTHAPPMIGTGFLVAELDLAGQLRAAMEQHGASQRGLGRGVARRLGWTESTGRRWIIKLLRGDVEQPQADSIAALEAELNVPAGYFKLPQQPTREARLTEIEHRLASVEDRLGLLAEQLVRLLDGQAGLARALERLADDGVRLIPAAPKSS